jgi:hypothetical protein
MKKGMRKAKKMPLLPEALPPRTGGTGRAQPLARLGENSLTLLHEERDGRILSGNRDIIGLLTKNRTGSTSAKTLLELRTQGNRVVLQNTMALK